jgi:formylglycine-generating enzyme required for sulfatase activity
MKRLSCWLFLTVSLTLTAALIVVARPAERAQRKVAFVVGVAKYLFGFDNLQFAERDAEELAAVLREGGFEVVLLTGSAEGPDRATTANIDARLKDLLNGSGNEDKAVRKGDLVLVALSGHGQQMFIKEAGPDGKEVRKEAPFFCPLDAKHNDPATLLNLSHVLDDLLAPCGSTNLLLVDACRDIADPNKGKGVEGHDMALKGPTAVLFSCARGEKSWENKDVRHGVFTHAILKSLRARGERREVTWTSLVDQVQEEMASAEFKKMLPEGYNQTPIPTSGQLPRTVLVALKAAPPPLPVNDVVELDLGGGVKLKMVRIPAKGKTFWMGAPMKEPRAGEGQHEVEFSRDFYLGATEVTQAQYRAVMGSNPSYFCKDGDGKEKVAGLDTDDFPVENVTWEQAKAFCDTVGEKQKDGQLYRLPTEAEWEYACRGGDSSKDTVPFYLKSGPTSSLSSGQINFNGNYPYGMGASGKSLERPAACGSFAESVNAFGLSDMHGNVYEWCGDSAGRHPTERVPDPTGSPKGGSRVFRGGGWTSFGDSCRASARGSLYKPSDKSSAVGLRLARVSVR